MKSGVLKLACVFALASAAAPAEAGLPAVKVGQIQSYKSCSVYANYWGQWFLLECERNFPQMRDRLQSAITEGGKLTLSSFENGRDIPAADLVVTGRVGGLGLTRSIASGNDYCIGKSTVTARIDLRVRNARSGAVVYAATITKTVEVGSDVEAGSDSCSSNTPAQSSYLTVQRELALAAARAVNFRLTPLRVVAQDGRRVLLNYGSPLLALGMIVQVASASGFPTRLRVVSATDNSATTEAYGEGGYPSVGSIGSVIEDDSPAANGRRTDRVELP